MDSFDFVIIGGGIVGLAAAYHLQKKHRGCSLAVLEKEGGLALHQSGRNSGVLHSGIYYKPGSLKARLCLRGKGMMEEFCRRHKVPFESCGKVIVATEAGEMPSLHILRDRARQNEIPCQLLDGNELREIEPHAAGVQALHIPSTGIIDFAAVCRKLGELLQENGAEILLGARVQNIEETEEYVVLTTTNRAVQARRVFNCGGLQCDRIAEMAGVRPKARILPFRGEYFQLKDRAIGLCKNLIYPLPDERFPFLGVHLSRTLAGTVICGPNAIFSRSREIYGANRFHFKDFFSSVFYPGFRALTRKHARKGWEEMKRSWSRDAFARAVQKLVPEVQRDDLLPAATGIRAQAVTPQGELVEDFLIERTARTVHVINAPSPAATASLAIGEYLAKENP